tara:strand:- start:13266 stop:14033 length:768 start_codon:yes stop_codon:yes gene_type:complete
MANKADKILLEELERFGQINEYVNQVAGTGQIGSVAAFEFPSRIKDHQKELGEQNEEGDEDLDLDLDLGGDDEVVDLDVETGDEGGDLDLDVETGDEDLDVEGGDEEAVVDDSTEEIDVTDLVTMAKDAESKAGKVVDTIEGQSGKIDGLVGKLDDLEAKLGEMDSILTAIDDLETKFEAMRPETPEEKLELRSLDSGPYSEKPMEFWDRKKDEMAKQKDKHEYVLTTDEAENFNDSDIKTTFESNYEPEEEDED